MSRLASTLVVSMIFAAPYSALAEERLKEGDLMPDIRGNHLKGGSAIELDKDFPGIGYAVFDAGDNDLCTEDVMWYSREKDFGFNTKIRIFAVTRYDRINYVTFSDSNYDYHIDKIQKDLDFNLPEGCNLEILWIDYVFKSQLFLNLMEISSKTAEEIDSGREKEDMKRLEAVFFVSGRYLSMQELISISDLNPIIIKEFIEKLQEKYNKDDSAIEIIEKNDLWKMDVKPDYSDIINKLATGSSEFSKSEQETLAIIAYKQPIKQSVLIRIRSNKAYDHIKKFSDLGLIKKKRMGHTYDLSLSDDFYDYFNVQDKNFKLKEI